MGIGKPFSRKEKPVLGLDIGSNTIKVMRLQDRSGSLMLKAVGQKELPPEAIIAREIQDRETVVFAIQGLVEEVYPKAKEVAISVSGSSVITDELVMDRKTGPEAEQAILFEAEQRSPFDVEDVTLDYHIINVDQETEKMQVLLVAARNQFLQSQLDLVFDAGLEPVLVDTDSLAILNCYELNYEIDPTKVIALVNLGFDITNVTFVKDGLYHSTRNLVGGARSIYEALKGNLQLSSEKALEVLRRGVEGDIEPGTYKATLGGAAEEICKNLDMAIFYFKNSTKLENIDQIMLSGGGALIQFLPELLQDKLSVPTETMNPLRNIEWDPALFHNLDLGKIAPALALVVGLASRRVK
jgi:type IV pilus assembly protein PilM